MLSGDIYFFFLKIERVPLAVDAGIWSMNGARTMTRILLEIATVALTLATET